MRIVIVRCVT